MITRNLVRPAAKLFRTHVSVAPVRNLTGTLRPRNSQLMQDLRSNHEGFLRNQRVSVIRPFAAAAASSQEKTRTPPEAEAIPEDAKTEAPKGSSSSEKVESKPDLTEELKRLTEDNLKLKEAQKESHTPDTEGSPPLRPSMGDRMRNSKIADRMRSFLPRKDENSESLEALYKEKYLRALAESENIRVRLTRQIDDAKQYGIQSFVKDLLEVSDILTKAMETVPEEALSDEENPHLKNLFEGLSLTEAQMTKVFKKHGLEKIAAMGAKFDPNVHEALFEAPPQEGHVPGTVMAVTQIGYKLHNRTIRPTRVGVVKAG